ncbi:hypothetical protein SAMN04488121_109232 [Chitinophaga filiformis]|uniref:Uncharacterized protein n=2 Tax=Chitinophaga filiformis TaxID=104663 RepID=A0A1G8AFE8_CHIFI|nr:hypothetical protein SAMN04488121_109232 [Chitinophaga filiformis]
MLDGRIATANNEVEAYLFGKAVAINAVGGSTQFGVVGTQAGQKYQQAMETLFYGTTFDLNAYQTAVSNFKEGSAANLQAKGIYNNFSVDLKLSNPVIKKFIPLLQ